jgi:outer membrane protein assembly factor BamE (lipoprotein component of BamABCDE complex)
MFRINQNTTLKQKLKNIQSKFFNENILAQRGNYLTKEEVDELRSKVTKPFKSKKIKNEKI